MVNNGKKYLPTSTGCFVCGEENPAGLHARFHIENDLVKTIFTVAPRHCGYPGIMHGGVVAAAVDECMAWAAARACKRCCVTGELTVRYTKPVPCDVPLTVSAWVTQTTRRLIRVSGAIEDAEGTLYARAKGTFVPMSPEETLTIDDKMIYRGEEERIFDELRQQHRGT